jgi:glycosyltransferase 2 family protein
MISSFKGMPQLKVLTKIFSFSVQFLSLYYLWSSMQKYDDSFLNNIYGYSSDWYIFIILILLYAITLALPALGWAKILNYYSENKVKHSEILWLYCRTAIAKYIPGNVFHYLSRQIHGSAFGLKQKVMGAASLLEISFVVSAGVLISLIFYPFVELPKNLTNMPDIFIVIVSLGVFVLPWLFLIGTNKFISLNGNKKSLKSFYNIGLFSSYFYYIFFLIFSSILFASVLFISGLSFLNSIYGIFIYGFVYVLSYVTPGAPGGIGVREALLVLFIGGMMAPGEAVSAVIIFRIITICGELLCFGLTFYFIPKDMKLAQNA